MHNLLEDPKEPLGIFMVKGLTLILSFYRALGLLGSTPNGLPTVGTPKINAPLLNKSCRKFVSSHQLTTSTNLPHLGGHSRSLLPKALGILFRVDGSKAFILRMAFSRVNPAPSADTS